MRRQLGAAALIALLAAACGSGSEEATTTLDATGGTSAISTPGLPATYTGPDGVETRVADASRIVTLSGDMTEIIFALGLGPNVVASDLSSVFPEGARATRKVGVEFRLVAEGVLAQTPTVVIGDEDARPMEAIEQIRQAGRGWSGPPSPGSWVWVPPPRSPRRRPGVGVDEAGATLATSVQAEIDAATAQAAGVTVRPRVALVYQASADTTLMLGPNSVMDGLFAAVRGHRCEPCRGGRRVCLPSAEALVAGDPEVIVTAQRGLERYLGGLDGFLALPGVAQTTAGREGRILVYEDLFLLGLGPRTGRLLARLFADLHPEAVPARESVRRPSRCRRGPPRARKAEGGAALRRPRGAADRRGDVASLALGAVQGCPREACLASSSTRLFSAWAAARVSRSRRTPWSGRSAPLVSCWERWWRSRLGAAGAALQGVFRNPLANPQLVGVASGATSAPRRRSPPPGGGCWAAWPGPSGDSWEAWPPGRWSHTGAPPGPH